MNNLRQQCDAWASEVAACPFCGYGEPNVNYFIPPYDANGNEQDAETGSYVQFYVQCRRCHATGPECDGIISALQKWNKVSNKMWGD